MASIVLQSIEFSSGTMAVITGTVDGVEVTATVDMATPALNLPSLLAGVISATVKTNLTAAQAVAGKVVVI